MVDVDELKSKVDGFLDKKGLVLESKYFLVKALLDDYWSEIRDGSDEADVVDELDEFEDAPGEVPGLNLPDIDDEVEGKVGSFIKKPRIPIKKKK